MGFCIQNCWYLNTIKWTYFKDMMHISTVPIFYWYQLSVKLLKSFWSVPWWSPQMHKTLDHHVVPLLFKYVWFSGAQYGATYMYMYIYEDCLPPWSAFTSLLLSSPLQLIPLAGKVLYSWRWLAWLGEAMCSFLAQPALPPFFRHPPELQWDGFSICDVA